MMRASTAVKLLLLGSALGLIGWYVYDLFQDEWHGGSGTHHSSHSGSRGGWFWSGTSRPIGTSGPARGGATVRGGFGGSAGAGE